MKSRSPSKVKKFPGRLAADPIRGELPAIARNAKRLVLKGCDLLDTDDFDTLIDEGIKSEHVPLTEAVWQGIRQRGTRLARKLRKSQ